ncbi:Major facilitator sugar transporter-like [Trinorchestia longiramus]|nr:Major facilitator sugar transporter-like [Trinorchestia longiramus]
MSPSQTASRPHDLQYISSPDQMTAKFEDLLAQVDSGPWTWMIFALCSIWGLFGAMQAVSAVFLSPVTAHWCHVTELQNTNWTSEQIKNVSIPWITETSSFSSCSQYERNYSDLAVLSYEEASNVPISNLTQACTAWDYDTSVFRSTVISEWDLVCDRNYLRSFVQSSFMVGVFVGCPTNGILADRFGRKRLLTVSLFMFLAMAGLAAVITWFPVFLLCRFFMAFSGHCVYQTSYIIAVETCSIRHRGTIGILFSVPFALGYILLPGFAYYIRDWRYLHLAISLPVALLIANTIVLPESPRWLIQNGQRKKAAKELQRAARWNRQKPLDSIWLTATIAEIHSTSVQVSPAPDDEDEARDEADSTSLSFWSALRMLFCGLFMMRVTVVLSLLWFTCTLVYYGIAMNSGNLSADPFVYTALGGAVELPCYFFGAAVVKRMGRRLTLILSLVITSLAILGPMAVPSADKTSWWFLSIVMVGKMMVTAGFQVLYLYTSELYPTCIRTQGLGVTSMLGRCGAIIAPFITDNLGSVHWSIPSLIFGLMSAGAAVVTFLLPETKSHALPDTVQEMEAWHSGVRKGDGGRSYEDTLLAKISSTNDPASVEDRYTEDSGGGLNTV